MTNSHSDKAESGTVAPRRHRTPRELVALVIRDHRFAFLVVGSINTLVGYGAFVAFSLTLGSRIDAAVNPIVGSLITLAAAHIVAALIAFALYRRFVFKVSGHIFRDLARFESVYLFALGINAVLLPVLVELGVNRLAAQAIVIPITTLSSYAGHRYFSFRRTPAEHTRSPASPSPASPSPASASPASTDET